MAEPLPCLRPTADGAALLLTVHVQPRAAKARIAGLHGDALKIAVTSPPVDNKANKAVVAFLAKVLHLPKAQLAITGGHHSRTKLIRIETTEAAVLRDRIQAAIAGATR